MALTDSLRILITCSGAQAEREFNKVGAAARRNLGQAENSAQQYGRVMTSAGVAMTAFGVVALAGLAKAAQAAEEENMALLRLQNSIQNMPELAGASTDAFLELAASMQDSTKFADDQVVSAEAMLGTFHLTEQQILRLTPLVADYAAKFGVDLVTASKQVGRAVSGSAGALQRNGIVLDQNAFAADHFGTVMDALKENAGGFAEQEGRTLSGQLAILKNNFDDIIEAVGGGAASAFGTLLAPVSAVSDAFGDMDPATASFIGKSATFAAAALTMAGGVTFLGGQALQAASKIKTMASTVGLLSAGGAFPAVAGFALAAGVAVAMFSKSQEHARDVQNFADALKQEADGFDGATDSALAHVLATDGAIKNYRDLGISAEDIVGAIRGERGAWENLATARAGAEAVMGDNDLHNPAIEQQANDVYHLVNAVESQRGAYREANAAQNEFEAALSATGDAAGMTAEAIDALTQEIEDYLSGAFDVPSAQRDLRASFEDLFGTLTNGTSSMDDISEALQKTVESTAAVVNAQVEQGASQESINATLAISRQRLMDTYNAGLITQEQFIQYSDVLDGIKPIVSTGVQAPGLRDRRTDATNYRAIMDDIDGDNVSSSFTATGLSAVYLQTRNLRAEMDNLDGRHVDTWVGIHTSGSAQLSAVGRTFPLGGLSVVGERGPELLSIPSGGRVFNNAESKMRMAGAGSDTGGDILITVPVHIDGEKVAEGQARVNRRYNIGRGEMD